MKGIIEGSELERFLDAIHERYGFDFSDYSEASLRRRIALFMETNKVSGISELVKELIAHEAMFERFVQGVSVTVTEMFRDPKFYLSLRQNVLPVLATYPVIKVWLAGCATGEEVYSLAILLREEGLLDRSVIYATDINQNSLKVAKEGIYPIAKMKEFTSNYLKAGGKTSFSSYYSADFGSVIFDRSLRKNVVFAPHNLTADKSFNEFQLVICRNVLIYFNHALQNKVFNLFHESLCPFGFLGLGSKESLLLAEKKKCFTDVDKKEKIFKKIL